MPFRRKNRKKNKELSDLTSRGQRTRELVLSGMLAASTVVFPARAQQIFPSDYAWHQDISNAPVAANSAAIINRIGAWTRITPNWSAANPALGASPLYGIPYNIVHGNSTAKVSVIIDNYPGESDIAAVPIPANAVLEGDFQNGPNPNGGGYNPNQRGDSHMIVWDVDNNIGYELFGVSRPSDPFLFPNTSNVEVAHTDNGWHAAQETVWKFSTDGFRTLGETSADAAGLSILAGLARPDEALPVTQGGKGVINHALRMTLPGAAINPQYIYPASHMIPTMSGPDNLPLGARLRLQNTPTINSIISNMPPQSQVLARAMQQYGLIVADIGSAMYVSGAPASVDGNNNVSLVWNLTDILASTGLEVLHAGDFDVVNLTPVVTSLSAGSGTAGDPLTINGQNFSGAAGHVSVFFGNAAAAVNVLGDTQISVTVPNGSGTVDVRVQSGVNETDNLSSNPNGNVNAPIFGYGTSPVTQADKFTYTPASVSPPTITNSFTPSSIALNSTATLNFAITNPPGNNSALTAVQFTDGLPAGLSVVDGSASPCGGSLTTTAATRTISLNGATIAANGTCQFGVTVKGVTAGVLYSSIGAVSSKEGGTGAPSNTAALTVIAPPMIGTAFGAASIPSGSVTSLSFAIANPSPNSMALTGVGFTDKLPAGLTAPDTTGTQCGGTFKIASNIISLTGATVAAGTSCNIQVVVTAATSGVKSNATSGVTSTNGGAGSASNTAVLSVTPEADLQVVSETISPSSPIAAGTSVTYTIKIKNNGPDLATGVTLTDMLPGNLTFMTCLAPGASSCGAAAGGVTAKYDLLAVNDSATLQIVATVNCTASDGSQITNKATVAGTTNDPDPSNNAASAMFTVTHPKPVVSPSAAVPVLWPPNADLINVGLAAKASDSSCPVPSSFHVNVYSNIADDTPINGQVFSPDAKNIAVGTLRLRAERPDSGPGRVYLIVVSATDAGGETGFGTAVVVVPPNKSAGGASLVDSLAQAAKSWADSNGGAPPPGYVAVGNGPVIGPNQ
jgi:uncharacterized repeat protein (TIGR01451 family)